MKFLALALILATACAKPDPHQADLTQVKFVLFTRGNSDSGTEIDFDFGDLAGTEFDSGKRTYVLVHGWNSGLSYSKRFVDDLLSADDSNIIGVDWSRLESWTNYFAAAQTSIEVGEHVGNFVTKLIEQEGVSHGNIHAVGHSLGGQAIGHLGRTVNSNTGSKVARLSVLDPARPWFELQDPSVWVSKNDGDFVDVIHSNSGPLWDGCLSFIEPLGHIDFYPNGGDHQPGCTEICAPNCTDNDLIDLIKGGCSHDRAIQYFIESINGGTKFTATECSDWESYSNGLCNGNPTKDMGYSLGTSSTGTYYLGVNDASPYAQG